MSPQIKPESPVVDPQSLVRQVAEQLGLESLDPAIRKEVLRELVRSYWGDLPTYSTLTEPLIMEVQAATVGAGVVPIFKHPDNGEIYAVMLRPGTHYTGPHYVANSDDPHYMIAGGFINLSCSAEIHGMPTVISRRAEQPHEGAVRELVEEIVDPERKPIILPHPDRLFPMIAKTLTFKTGEIRVVIGYVLELDGGETERILDHIKKVDDDPEYRAACRANTVSQGSGLPEVCRVDAIPLSRVLSDDFKLLHPDQRSLFERIHGWASYHQL